MADPAAPPVCLVAGSTGCGKSELLAWLVAHGSRSGTSPERRVHAVAPLRHRSLLSVVWNLADQLGVVARTAGDLVAALGGDKRMTTIVLPDLHSCADPEGLVELVEALLELGHVRLIVEAVSGSAAAGLVAALGPALMDLDHGQWTDAGRLAAWRGSAAAARLPAGDETAGSEGAVLPDLDDCVQVIGSDPMAVSALYQVSSCRHRGLRAAWMRAGQSLSNEPDRASRALVLRAALDDSADPRLARELAALAGPAPWDLVWSRVRGDIQPPWPGPALALLADYGAGGEEILVIDHFGVVRRIYAVDAAPAGRLPTPFSRAHTLAAPSETTLVTLNQQGHLEIRHHPTTPAFAGIQALLDDGPTSLDRLLETVREHLSRHPASALAASTAVLATADDTGAVYVYLLRGDTLQPRVASLHQGPVTALAVMDVEAHSDTEPGCVLYSGGSNGHVRAWSPDREPLEGPVAARSWPVTALAAKATVQEPVLAIAWADGLVEYRGLESGRSRTFRPGAPVFSLTVSVRGELFVGTDESVVCLRPI